MLEELRKLLKQLEEDAGTGKMIDVSARGETLVFRCRWIDHDVKEFKVAFFTSDLEYPYETTLDMIRFKFKKYIPMDSGKPITDGGMLG